MGGTIVSASSVASQHDVVVVGFGPVGATMAGLLARRGLDVLVIDRDTDVFLLPRAAHMDQEALRILQELGALDDVLPSTQPLRGMDFLTADRQVLLSMRAGARTRAGFPSSSLFHQPGVDRAIRHHAQRLGARTLLGTEVTGLVQGEDHVVVELAGHEPVAASWVVACDGARSMARKAIGTAMHDLQFEEPWLVLDLVLDEGVAPPTDVCFQVCDPARPHTLVPMPSPRFRFEFMLLPGEDPAWIQRPEVIDDLLSAWLDPSTATVERAAVYTFHGLLAHDWRRGRVLLAGDAAHQMPPFLGQGMCSGLRDAANLAWKLARVARGEAPDALLDTYQAEREPHVRSIVEAAVNFGRLICTTDREVAAQRDAGMLAARATAGEQPPNDGSPMPPLVPGPLVADGGGEQAVQVMLDGQRADDVLFDRFVVVRRAPGDDAAVTAWQAASAAVLDAVTTPAVTEVLDTAKADVVVIRPDRYVYAAGAVCPPVPALLTTG